MVYTKPVAWYIYGSNLSICL